MNRVLAAIVAMGLSWAAQAVAQGAAKPDVVMLSTCLFGQTGPLSSVAGYGTMAAAFAGFVQPTGWPDRPPCGPFGPYTDWIAPRFTLAEARGYLRPTSASVAQAASF